MRHGDDQETKERAVRMFEERREEQADESRKQALQHLSGLIGVLPDTIRGWVDRARVDAGEKPGLTTSEREEIKTLRKELRRWMRSRTADIAGFGGSLEGSVRGWCGLP